MALRVVPRPGQLAVYDELPDELREAYPFMNRIFRQGDLGVPLFFVVSGYCMMASARSAVRRDEPVKSYLWRRLMRIFPPPGVGAGGAASSG